MKKRIMISIMASSLLVSALYASSKIAIPLPAEYLAVENSGLKTAMDAYQDGIGIYALEGVGAEKIDNSEMNALIFKYGDKANELEVSVKDYIQDNGSELEKKMAINVGKFEPIMPANGTVCNDSNIQTINDAYHNGVCVGTNVEGQTCNDGNAQTINDVYHNGICAGTAAYVQLDNTVFWQLAGMLKNNLSSFKNTGFYNYLLDGGTTKIGDGGSDMYDNGNMVNLYYNGNIFTNTMDYSIQASYSNGIRVMGLGNSQPIVHVATGAINVATQFGFGKSGNNGADGGGSHDMVTVASGSLSNGFTVNAKMRRVYGTSDPSINDLYVTIGHSKWNSTFLGDRYMEASTTTDNNFSHYETESINSVMISVLLSKPSGVAVSESEANTVINNVTLLLKNHFGF